MEEGRRRQVALLALLLFLCAPLWGEELDRLAAEFRELRGIPSWFDGGSEYVARVDSWGGRKQEVMGQLGQALGDGKHTVADVQRWMGPADLVLAPGDAMWSRVRGSQGLTRCLVYKWRGLHDFMYFKVAGDRVVGVDWWMAYE